MQRETERFLCIECSISPNCGDHADDKHSEKERKKLTMSHARTDTFKITLEMSTVLVQFHTTVHIAPV